MAFLPSCHLTPDELEQEGFVFEGWFADCIPIYLSDPEEDEFPLVAARNWVPEWLLDLAIHVCVGVAFFTGLAGGEACPGFPVTLTRCINGDPINFIEDD